jgi:hypothetical protein
MIAAFMTPKKKTHRPLPRLRMTLPFRLPDGWRGEVFDLSAIGMRIRSVAVLSEEAIVEGKLETEGMLIPVKAQVIWCKPPGESLGGRAEIGLKILDPSETYLALVASLFADDEES